MVCSAHQITKNEDEILKSTVLLTKNPSAFSKILSDTNQLCKVSDDFSKLSEIFYKLSPELILIDCSTQKYHQSCLCNFLDTLTEPRPTVVYGTIETLSQILQQLSKKRESFRWKIPTSFNKALDTALLSFSFSPALKGYQYIKQACYYQYLNTMEISAVKKDIYESVSSCYKTTVYSVERGITFAIKKAYAKSPAQFQEMFFGESKPPSNMAFLKTFFIHLEQDGYL